MSVEQDQGDTVARIHGDIDWVERLNAGLIRILNSLVLGNGSALLDQVDLRSGHAAGRHEGAVLGTDHRQVALGLLGTVLGRLQLALETADTRRRLLRHALLRTRVGEHDCD